VVVFARPGYGRLIADPLALFIMISVQCDINIDLCRDTPPIFGYVIYM
jgi:hypothetical protein